MGDCQSVPSRETPPFRRPITLLVRGLFRPRTTFGPLNAVKIKLNDASITSYAGNDIYLACSMGCFKNLTL